MTVAGMTFIVGNRCCARPKERTFGPKPAAKDLRRWANDPLAAGFKFREVHDAIWPEGRGGIRVLASFCLQLLSPPPLGLTKPSQLTQNLRCNPLPQGKIKFRVHPSNLLLARKASGIADSNHKRQHTSRRTTALDRARGQRQRRSHPACADCPAGSRAPAD